MPLRVVSNVHPGKGRGRSAAAARVQSRPFLHEDQSEGGASAKDSRIGAPSLIAPYTSLQSPPPPTRNCARRLEVPCAPSCSTTSGLRQAPQL